MSVNLSPLAGAGWQFFDNNGIPLSGGLLYTYTAGTSTPLATYTSSAGNVANSNPIVLDAAGRVPQEIWLTTSTAYKFVLQTASFVQIGSWDNINSFNATAADIFYNEGCSGAIDQTVQTKLQQFLDVRDFGSFSEALSCANSGTIKNVVVSSTVVGDGVYVPSGVNLVVNEGGLITISESATFTINGKLTAGNYQIFSIPSNSLGILFTGFVVFGTDSVEYVTPTWWGADNTVGNYLHNTAAVQTAINTQLPVTFTGNYTIDNVILSTNGQTIRFNGFTLTGGSNYGAAYVLKINAGYLSLHDVNINVNFNSYGCAVIWQSDATHTANFNNIYGLNITNSVNGLVFGNFISVPSYNATQSENTIYGFTVRAVQVPFTGNQTNGFITLVAPTLDCAPYEWASQPGYNATTFNTNAYAFNNVVGSLEIIGGEVLKTTSQLGYGMAGQATLIGVTLEIASTQALISGDFLIQSNIDGYMSATGIPAFVFATGATSQTSVGATLTLDNFVINRGNGTADFSGAQFITGTPTLTCFVIVKNTRLINWNYGAFLDSAATNIKLSIQNLSQTILNSSNVIEIQSIAPDTDSITTTAIASAATISPITAIVTVSGTAAINTIGLPYVGFTGSITLIPTGAFTTTLSGNIALATTAVVGKALIMTYDGSKWHPSY